MASASVRRRAGSTESRRGRSADLSPRSGWRSRSSVCSTLPTGSLTPTQRALRAEAVRGSLRLGHLLPHVRQEYPGLAGLPVEAEAHPILRAGDEREVEFAGRDFPELRERRERLAPEVPGVAGL